MLEFEGRIAVVMFGPLDPIRPQGSGGTCEIDEVPGIAAVSPGMFVGVLVVAPETETAQHIIESERVPTKRSRAAFSKKGMDLIEESCLGLSLRSGLLWSDSSDKAGFRCGEPIHGGATPEHRLLVRDDLE